MSTGAILLCEADDTDRKALGYVLTHEGFAVHEVETAEQTIQVAQRDPIGLIILGLALWQTPRMDTLSVLKRNPKTRQIPILLFGQPQSKEQVQKALRTGANSLIVRKGFEIKLFVDKVRETMAGQSGATPGGGSAAAAADPADKLTETKVVEHLAGIDLLAAFEFNITDVISGSVGQAPTVNDLTDIALRDPMLTVAVLSRANSVSHRRSREPVADVREAIAGLGTSEFYKLAEFIPSFQGAEASDWDAGAFWAHSVATARTAEMLASKVGLAKPSEVRTAGLLHDLGYHVLACHFSQLFDRLAQAAAASDDPPAELEKAVLGASVGQLAGWTLARFGVPEAIRDVVAAHQGTPQQQQRLKASSRLVSMIVGAADRIAAALLPTDPLLTPLATLSNEFQSALARAKIAGAEVIEEARKLVAELAMEMASLFPGSASQIYKKQPIDSLIYYAPRGKFLDLCKTYFDVRCSSMVVLTQIGAPIDIEAPMVANLLHTPRATEQVETLNAIKTAGMFENRKGLVLLPAAPGPELRKIVPSDWRLVATPTRPRRWLGWLAGTN